MKHINIFFLDHIWLEILSDEDLSTFLLSYILPS